MQSYEIRGVVRFWVKDKEKVVVTVRNKESGEYQEIDITGEQDVVQAVARKLKVDKNKITIPKHVKIDRR
jgi:hypothetical protein